MGTEHLKARCICPGKPGQVVQNPGCPIHGKSTDFEHDSVQLAADESFDVINKAAQYNQHPSGVEAIDICRHLTGDWFNAFKYVFRADFKGGRQDIEKAVYYAEDAVKHSIPMWLPSYDLEIRELLDRVIYVEGGARKFFFMAFAAEDPTTAALFAHRVLEGYDDATDA